MIDDDVWTHWAVVYNVVSIRDTTFDVVSLSQCTCKKVKEAITEEYIWQANMGSQTFLMGTHLAKNRNLATHDRVMFTYTLIFLLLQLNTVLVYYVCYMYVSVTTSPFTLQGRQFTSRSLGRLPPVSFLPKLTNFPYSR